MEVKVENLKHLAKIKHIPLKDILKVISRPTYYSWANRVSQPVHKRQIKEVCELF